MPKTYAKPDPNSSMSSTVYRPYNSSVWYARATRPRSLDHLPGQKEFRRSTGQRDKRKAKAVAAKLIAAQWNAWLELMSEPLDVDALPTVLTPTLVRQLCAVRLY